MPIATRLTERLGIAHPVISAPMDLASGGALASAVSAAGGLGLIGGGYGDEGFLAHEFAAAGNQRVGCGFITWSLAKKPDLLTRALERKPAAIMLSFGDPAPFANEIASSGATLICQIQNLRHAREALAAGAGVIVAQGAEAAGHGSVRGGISLVPEVADLIAKESPRVALVAAGGIADGRGLAAALMLGADGVLMGSRFWASKEARVHPNQHVKALASTGDDTIRQTATDIVRGYAWPAEFTGRILKNAFTEKWVGREKELVDAAPSMRESYFAAFRNGDVENAGVLCGEAAGLIHDVPSAREIVERTVAEAETLLNGARNFVRSA